MSDNLSLTLTDCSWPDVLEEHFQEITFLFATWRKAQSSWKYTPQSIARGLESRLVAHLDGMLVEGTHAVLDAVVPRLEEPSSLDEPEELAAAVLLAGVTNSRDVGQKVASLIEPLVETDLHSELIAALGAVGTSPVSEALRVRFEQSPNPSLLRVLLGADIRPFPRGETLVEHPELRAIALRHAAEFTPEEGRIYLQRALHDEGFIKETPDELLVQGLLTGSRGAWSAAKARVIEGRPSRRLLGFVGYFADEYLVRLALERSSLQAERLRTLTWALGFSRTRNGLEHLSGCLEHPELSRVAGDSLAHILNLSLQDRGYFDHQEAPLPELPEDFEEDDLEGDLLPVWGFDLPKPKASEIRRVYHQKKEADGFDDERRRGWDAPVPQVLFTLDRPTLSADRFPFVAAVRAAVEGQPTRRQAIFEWPDGGQAET